MITQTLSSDENRDRKIRVIVVDRYTLVREGLRRILASEADIEVVGVAGDGPQALELTTRLRPDVVILDADLPGVEDTIQSLAPGPLGARVLVLSANGGVQRAVNLLCAGAMGYLSKSTASHDLITAVHHVRHGKMALGPAVAREVLDHLAHRRCRMTNGGHDPHKAVTEREMEVLRLLCQGHSDKEIAQQLYISVRTVGVHLHNIYDKLGVHSRTEAALYALRRGWVTLK